MRVLSHVARRTRYRDKAAKPCEAGVFDNLFSLEEEILKINPVESEIARASKKPDESHTAQCALLDDAGKYQAQADWSFRGRCGDSR